MRFNERVERVMRDGDKLVVCSDGHRTTVVDSVIAGLGILPETAPAQSAGLQLENGIVVDRHLRTSNPDIFAAGDVANFFCTALDRRLRFEHEDNARAMGRIAGRNMAGEAESYRHLPLFYSDLFDLGYEAVGDVDNCLKIVEDWVQKFRKGTIYYLARGHVRGVLLWNTWGLADRARDLIASGREIPAASLIGRLRDDA